jgi:hypothetical protein
VAVLAAGLAATATLLPGSPAGPRIQPGGPGTSASASPSPSPSYNPDTPTAARLTTALQGQIKAYLPTATFTPGTVGGVEPLSFIERQHSWYEATATIHTSGGVGGLAIGVTPPGPEASQPSCATLPPGTTCSTVRAGDTTVYVYVRDYATGAQSVRMEALRTDGTDVWLELDNYDPTSVPQVKNPPDPTRGLATQPLTQDQQVSVVTNPQLSG